MAATNQLLPLFKSQLEAEFGSLATRLGLTKRGLPLIYWYFERLHEFTDSDVADVVCDGSGDLGIDAIWIDQDELVHFYQFKNPHETDKGISGGEIDKMISGLRLILSKNYSAIANQELRDRLDEVYQRVPTGYRIHVVSSGMGLEHESVLKLDSLTSELSGPTGTLVKWDEQPLSLLQERFYQQTLPAVAAPLRFDVQTQPYMLKSGSAECYLFSVSGTKLAEIYDEHKEGLLQRNIRVDQRDTATNRSIEGTCAGGDSANFLHFNNGVTFICDKANWDPFQKTLTLERAQVVNGGQTIRAISRASAKGALKSDVVVAARAIASSADKDFANNVAVNQNNQNQLAAGFLRSNDQIVIQLDHALAAKGWFLERREGELKTATASETAGYEQRIGRSLHGRTITLKDGAQAYTATFYGQPEIAKKNVSKIFLSQEDGGHYEKIFSIDMTADKVIISHIIKEFVDDFVREFAKTRKTALISTNMVDVYTPVLGVALASAYSDQIHQVVPQCSLFLCGTVYRDLTLNRGMASAEIPQTLEAEGRALVQEHLLHMVNFAKRNPDKADKSWPALLKSNTFFGHVTAYVAGIRTGARGSL